MICWFGNTAIAPLSSSPAANLLRSVLLLHILYRRLVRLFCFSRNGIKLPIFYYKHKILHPKVSVSASKRRPPRSPPRVGLINTNHHNAQLLPPSSRSPPDSGKLAACASRCPAVFSSSSCVLFLWFSFNMIIIVRVRRS